MLGIGIGELIVIFFVVFLLFGPKALTDIAKGIGQTLKLINHEMKKIQEDVQDMDVPVATKSAVKPTEANQLKNSSKDLS